MPNIAGVHAQHRAGLRGIEPSPIGGRRSPHRAGDQRGPVFGIGCTQSDQGVTDTSEDRVIRRCFLQDDTESLPRVRRGSRSAPCG